MRAFIAVELAPPIKAALEGLIRELRRKGGGGISWIKPDAMHLTLKFLGDILDEKAPDVSALLGRVAAGRRPFPLKLKGTGTFPPGARADARVLWAGIEEVPELMDLQAALEAECERAGFPREDRAFHPHMTLGRVRSRDGLEAVIRELERNRDIDLGEMSVTAVTLFRSVLSPSGAVHTALSRAELR